MFELYAVWASLGPWLDASFSGEPSWRATGGGVAFVAVAAGALGCVVAGGLSLRWGERRVAVLALLGSGLCCVVSPWMFLAPAPWVAAFVCLWGLFVIADSAQFSALATRACPPALVGSALAAMNGVGFAITIASIQLVAWLAGLVGWQWALAVLAFGPAFGLWQLRGAVDPSPAPIPKAS
jgi:MFS family permease